VNAVKHVGGDPKELFGAWIIKPVRAGLMPAWQGTRDKKQKQTKYEAG